MASLPRALAALNFIFWRKASIAWKVIPGILRKGDFYCTMFELLWHSNIIIYL